MIILSFNTWWQVMELTEKVYWTIAIPFTLIFLIQLVMTFFGGDIHSDFSTADPDLSVDSDHGLGFQYLSIKNLIGFFTIFGWTGIAMIHGEKSLFATVLISTLAGLFMMLIMSSLIYFMAKLNEDGSLNIKNAIGKVGTVYLTIPKSRSGMGKVQIKVQGFQTLDALTDDVEDIKTGSVIQVVDLVNDDVLLVRKNK